jgi:hypothetical protein
LEPALLLRAEARTGSGHAWRGNGLASVLRAEHRSAEVAGKRRAKLRHTAIIARQTGDAVSGWTVLGRVEFLVRTTAIASLKRIDERAADPDAGE